jgi:hypothetical protein
MALNGDFQEGPGRETVIDFSRRRTRQSIPKRLVPHWTKLNVINEWYSILRWLRVIVYFESDDEYFPKESTSQEQTADEGPSE